MSDDLKRSIDPAKESCKKSVEASVGFFRRIKESIRSSFNSGNGKWQKIMIAALAVVTVVSVIVTISVVNSNKTHAMAPEFAPIETDENAEALSDSDAEKMDHEEGGGAVSLTYSNAVTVSLKEKDISILFQNPSKSTQDIVLQVLVTNGEEEIVIGQSEKLPAGYMLRNMELLDTVKLSEGGYNGRFNVLFYDPETGERAMVNTNIPVTITVKE